MISSAKTGPEKTLEVTQKTGAATNGLVLGDFLLLLCVSIWAFNVPLVKMALDYVSPLALSMLRFGVAGVILLVMVWVRERDMSLYWRHIPGILLCSFLGIFLNQVFFVYALKNSTSAEVSLLMGSTPSFAVLVAWLLKQEKVKSNYWKSLPISIAGISLIVLSASGAHLAGGWFGDFLALCTSASWAAYTVCIRPLMRYYSITKLSAYITFTGTFMILPFGAPQIDLKVLGTIPPHVWMAIIYSTLGAVVLTNILWYFGVKQLGGPRTAVYSYLQPFIGVLAAALILGEPIVGWQVVGGVLVILGMLIYRRNRLALSAVDKSKPRLE